MFSLSAPVRAVSMMATTRREVTTLPPLHLQLTPAQRLRAGPVTAPGPHFKVVLLHDGHDSDGLRGREVVRALSRVFTDMTTGEAEGRVAAARAAGAADLRVLPQPMAELRCEQLRAQTVRAVIQSVS